jgi:hypothetical protein
MPKNAGDPITADSKALAGPLSSKARRFRVQRALEKLEEEASRRVAPARGLEEILNRQVATDQIARAQARLLAAQARAGDTGPIEPRAPAPPGGLCKVNKDAMRAEVRDLLRSDPPVERQAPSGTPRLTGEALDAAAAGYLAHNPGASNAAIARAFDVDRQRLSDPSMKSLRAMRARLELEAEERREQYAGPERQDALAGGNE